MPEPPTPEEVYDRAEREGRRRLGMSPLESTSTAFIAGVTIVIGIVALGVVEALLEPAFGRSPARIGGAMAFGLGLVFLVVGRSELFTENFFDPVAAAIDAPGPERWRQLVRLWATTLALNLVGGAVLLAVMTVDGALPSGSGQALVRVAEDIAAKTWTATLARAVLAGALIALLSYMLAAAGAVTARILTAYLVGFLLALGPFDHVVVSALHLLAGIWLSGRIGYGDLGQNLALSTLGNLLGGLCLITLTHTAQVWGARGRSG